MMGLIVRLVVWLVKVSNNLAPEGTYLPLKWVGITTASGRRERVALAVRHDTEWDQHLDRSWNKKGYWYYRTGNRKLGTLQVMDLIIEWRIGRKVNK